MKKSEEDCLKYAVCESTRAPPKREANPASLCSAAPSKGRGSRGHSLLPMEGGAPKGRRLDGGKRYERERGRSSQVRRLREYPIHRCAVSLPQWGRLRNGESGIFDTKPSPRGEGGERSEPDRVLAMKKRGGIISGRRFTKALSTKTTYKTYL